MYEFLKRLTLILDILGIISCILLLWTGKVLINDLLNIDLIKILILLFICLGILILALFLTAHMLRKFADIMISESRCLRERLGELEQNVPAKKQ